MLQTLMLEINYWIGRVTEILDFMKMFIQSTEWTVCWKVSHGIHEGEAEVQNIVYKVVVLEINLADDMSATNITLSRS